MWTNYSIKSDAASTVCTLAGLTSIVLAAWTLVVRYRCYYSQHGRQQRETCRKQSQALVGPSPQMVDLPPAVSSKDNDDDTRMEHDKAQLLTSYYRKGATEVDNRSPQTTVVLIHGFGCTSMEFHGLVEHLQKKQPSLNIFEYDRVICASPSVADSRPRDTNMLVEELHHLLQARQVPPPYLLIGHSYGGLLAQQFAHMYPNKVQGMVLIDPAHELQFQRFPTDFSWQFIHLVPLVFKVYQRMAWTGILQFLDKWNLFNFPPLFLLDPEDPIRNACVQLYSEAHVWKTVNAELQGCIDSFQELQSNTTFRKELYAHNIPTGLVIAGDRKYSPTLFPKAVTQAFLDLHEDMPAKVFLASQSDHWVHLQDPEIIMEAVDYVVNQVIQDMHGE